MTGIERLRKLIEDYRTGHECDGFECTELSCGKCMAKNVLEPIADRIEREQGGRVSRMRVLAVVIDMERHVSGVEGMEDSPVARWARELRGALGDDVRKPANYASISAYDLRPQEDREEITWVRERGGLDAVKRRWECLSYYADPVPRSCMEKRLARLQRQIDECHEALRRRNQRIEELGCRVSDLTTENAELRKRAMPESYEWPRFESGEPVMLGDSVVKYVGGGKFEVRSVEFRDGATYLREGFRTEGIVIVRPGERVKRPAPKVYDADGAEIREGDRVWSTHLDEPHEWIVINPHEDRGDSQTVLVSIGDGTGHARPEDLTHQRPVLDADGVSIKKGDTVYLLPGEWCDKFPCHGFHGGEELEVFAAGEADHVPGGVQCREKEKTLGIYGTCYPQPDQLTHTKPEPVDTWQRIEEDAEKTSCAYFGMEEFGYGCSECPVKQWEESCDEVKSSDLVRRCRALAERERGE